MITKSNGFFRNLVLTVPAFTLAPYGIFGLAYLDTFHGTHFIGGMVLFFGASFYFLLGSIPYLIFNFGGEHFTSYGIAFGPKDLIGVGEVMLSYLGLSILMAACLTFILRERRD